ncbi:FKBP-type peptidyl-prolyl cis-trans isomerase [Desulfovibrio inopinatus]|uniref:FKBP-type peptidyl-prolyl cis-trans isomerase n=1 Tax=Desulfovibrio inopinatus TaxID=102109 RepID=UPI0004120708|nr:FKBP-type peptidyl-prolyl cis-trans isomerase [Desulfovibrio inopinatus]
MPKAQAGSQVEVHYTGSLNDGTVFDSSKDRDPLSFTVGTGAVIPGFEKAIVGMDEGETKTVTFSPEEGYGDHMEHLVIEVNKTELPPEIAVGSVLQAEIQGQQMFFNVMQIEEEKVTLDGNHPLAGKDLTFEITLVKSA